LALSVSSVTQTPSQVVWLAGHPVPPVALLLSLAEHAATNQPIENTTQLASVVRENAPIVVPAPFRR